MVGSSLKEPVSLKNLYQTSNTLFSKDSGFRNTIQTYYGVKIQVRIETSVIVKIDKDKNAKL